MGRIFVGAVALFLAATPVIAADTPEATAASLPTSAKGKMLTAADGGRLAAIYRVTPDGAQIILDGHMVTVPAATVSQANGKFVTSLSRAQVLAQH